MSVAPSTRQSTPRASPLSFILGFGIVFGALSLRAPVISVTPLLDTIQDATGLSGTAASLLTTLPILCFGLLAPLAPWLARRFGIDLIVWATMVVIAVGTALRLIPSLSLLFFGTALAGAAIAVSNVLFPALVKRDFSGSLGLMTGLYTLGISGGGAIGVGLTIPLQNALDLSWRGAISMWAIPAAIAAVIMLPRLAINRRNHSQLPASRSRVSLWRDGLAWQVTLLMGLQSFGFFTMTTWLPTLFIERGMTGEYAGFLMLFTNICGMVASFVTPLILQRTRNHRLIVVALTASWSAGLLGVLFATHTATLLWMFLIGLATGSFLSFALTVIVLRAPDVSHAATLSGMAQAVGYSLAAVGPITFGAIRDGTQTWFWPFLLLFAALALLLWAGAGAARWRYVGDGEAPTAETSS